MGQALMDVDEHLTVLWFGEGGTGKTSNLCAMANLGRVLIINAEGRVRKRVLDRLKINTKNIEVFPEPGGEVSFESLTDEWLRVYEVMKKKPGYYVGVGFDSLTEIYLRLLDDIRKDAETKAEATGKRQDPRKDYGEMADKICDLVRKYRDLPCHFAATALDRRDVDDDGAVVYRPAVTPALQPHLNLWFDLLGHTSVVTDDEDEEHYLAHFRPVGKRRGKDNLKIMPPVVAEPTFPRVLAYVEEKVTLSTDKITQNSKKKLATKD